MDGEKFSTESTEAQVNEEAQPPLPQSGPLKGGSTSTPTSFRHFFSWLLPVYLVHVPTFGGFGPPKVNSFNFFLPQLSSCSRPTFILSEGHSI